MANFYSLLPMADRAGSFDIFMSERLDDTWKNWSIPVNMGPAVNTDGRELYFRKFENLNQAVLLLPTTAMAMAIFEFTRINYPRYRK